MSTLAQITNRLRQEDPSLVLRYGWYDPHSYRGSYYELSFAPVENVTVASCLAACEEANGSTYQGWKGGEFTMGDHTDCYLAEEGDCGDELSLPWLELNIELSKPATS